MNVIDISKHQSSFNPTTAKTNGIEAVIIRHAYGTTADTLALSWASSIKSANLKLGGYGFATWHYRSLNGGSVTTARALMQSQVNKWIELAQQSGVDWWFAIDQELESGNSMGLSMDDNTTLISEAATLLSNAGLNPCLYCSVSWDMSYIKTANLNCPYWMARYYDGIADFGDSGSNINSLPAGQYTNWMLSLYNQGKLVGWQFASQGYGSKYGAGSASIDRNIFYLDPDGYDNGDNPSDVITPTTEPSYVVFGPVSSGDALQVKNKMDELSIGYNTVESEDGLSTIVTAIPISSGDQVTFIQMAKQMEVPIRLTDEEGANSILNGDDTEDMSQGRVASLKDPKTGNYIIPKTKTYAVTNDEGKTIDELLNSIGGGVTEAKVQEMIDAAVTTVLNTEV